MVPHYRNQNLKMRSNYSRYFSGIVKDLRILPNYSTKKNNFIYYVLVSHIFCHLSMSSVQKQQRTNRWTDLVVVLVFS